MANKKPSQTQKLYEAFMRGRTFTTRQIMATYGFKSPNSASAAVSHLQRDRGIDIVAVKGRDGVLRYSQA